MDSTKIGLVIKEIRSQAGLTQSDFAKELCVTDKAVSKWENGMSIPDLQQLEAISKQFNVSYDVLLNGDLDKVKLNRKQEKAQAKAPSKYNSQEWYALDNAAKIYPSQARKGWNMVFRIAAVLKEPIDVPVLQQALSDMMDRFPTFMVTLKNGFFWNYFDRLEKSPKVIMGGNHPCIAMPLDGKKYIFRVSVENNRIACDYFHVLTDGTGGTIFLTSLLTRYYELKYGPIKDYKDALNVLDIVQPEEIEDSFARYAQKKNYESRPIKRAYHMKGRKVKKNIVTHVVMSVDELKKISKEKGCTITVLLLAILTRAFLKKKALDRDDKPFIIQVPINLRKRFPSKTLRNFAYFTGVETSAKELTLEEAIEVCKEELNKGTDVDHLQRVINSNMREENNIFIKAAPLFAKNLVLGLVSKVIGDDAFTTTFSNVGNVNAPDELKNIVDRYEFVLKDDKNGGILMSGISFNGRCTISFIRSVAESNVEREFVRELASLGVNLYVESNGGEERA